MMLRLIKPWRYRKVGTILNVADGAANLLIKLGKAEEVKPEEPKQMRSGRRAIGA